MKYAAVFGMTLILSSLQAGSAPEAMSKGFHALSSEPGAGFFQPPNKWGLADKAESLSRVKLFAIGRGKREYPPSMNLAVEDFDGSASEYMRIVQRICSSKGHKWKDLGSLSSEAGALRLCQVDKTTQWGDVRMMHTFFVENGRAYIVTAAALEEEFSNYYKDFHDSFRSFRINPDVFELVSDEGQRAELKARVHAAVQGWIQQEKPKLQGKEGNLFEQAFKELVERPAFVRGTWTPLEDWVAENLPDQDERWVDHLRLALRRELHKVSLQ